VCLLHNSVEVRGVVEVEGEVDPAAGELADLSRESPAAGHPGRADFGADADRGRDL
jgi:hypothetical protein